MPESYTVTIKLVANNRPCWAGHRIGQEWTFENMVPAGMCASAWHTVYPYALAMSAGGVFPWQDDPEVMVVSCPDSQVQNIFELRRDPRKAGA